MSDLSLPVSPAGSTHRYREAFEVTAGERATLAASQIVALNVDVLVAVSVVNAALPAIASLRPAIEGAFRTFDLDRFDRLPVYTWALQHAQVRFVAATRPVEPVQALVERGSQLRELLRSDATALAKRGVLDAQQLRRLRGGTGHRSLAFDLQVLAALLGGCWSLIGGKTMVQEAEVEEAEALGDDLSDAVDGRKRASRVALTATDDRVRAFTLFHRAYVETRRAALFVRWHEGDGGTLVPSIYRGRGGRSRRRGGETRTTPEPPVEPSQGVPAGHQEGGPLADRG